jgi:hypothetical protein
MFTNAMQHLKYQQRGECVGWAEDGSDSLIHTAHVLMVNLEGKKFFFSCICS